MSDPENNREDIQYMEQELAELDESLKEAYYEAGKALLEVAEIEGQKVNRIVDEIITLRRRLTALRGRTEKPTKKENNL